jgi:hypothetical protein
MPLPEQALGPHSLTALLRQHCHKQLLAERQSPVILPHYTFGPAMGSQNAASFATPHTPAMTSVITASRRFRGPMVELAEGTEWKHASLLHLMSKQSQILKALQVGLVALCATVVYETTEPICFPRMSVVQSQIITIIFAGCVGFRISFIIRQREKAAEQKRFTFSKCA